MSEPLASRRRAAAFVFLELVALFALAAMLRLDPRGAGSMVVILGPAVGLVLLAPALRPHTRAGGRCRTGLLAIPAAHAVVLAVLAAAGFLGDEPGSMYPSSAQYIVGFLLAFWSCLVLPVAGLVCWRFLAIAAWRAEHAAFLAVAGASLAPLLVGWPMVALEALLGRTPR